MPISAPAGYLDVTNATLRGSQIVTTGYVGVANANPVNHLSVGSNLHVNDTASNVLQVSGNVSANRFILGGISIEPTFDLESVTNVGNVTPYTVEFRNDTTGFYSSSNVEVGTANLFVDTTTGRVGVGTESPDGTLHVITGGNTGQGLTLQNSDVKTVLSHLPGGNNRGFIQTFSGVTSSIPTSSSTKYPLCLQPYGSYVGIGTDAPTTTLDVNGSVRISGAMSLPGLPYAFVTYGSNLSWSYFNNAILPHGSVISQSSHNAFNTSTYKFTCPNDGVYKMTVSNLVGQNGYAHLYFMKNTTTLQPNVHLNQNSQGAQWFTMTGDYIVACSAGDELYINAATAATADIYAHPSYGYAFYQQIA